MTDNTELLAELRNTRGYVESELRFMCRKAADALESREAEVQQLRDVIEQARADAWDEGRQSVAIDMLKPSTESGMKLATSNPYRPAVALPETGGTNNE